MDIIKIRILSLFSDCGGLDLGFERTGLGVPIANEYDKTIRETFKVNHPKENNMPVLQSTIMRRRIQTVIDNLILNAGHLTNHTCKLHLTLILCNGWIYTFLRVAKSL